MRICAVTMHGPDTFDLWKGAYESAKDLVDGFMGRHPQGPVRDFSSERNTMLEMASDDNYDWALMLDTDERIIVERHHWADPEGDPWKALRVMLGLLHDVDVVMVPHVSGTYEKERIFRLPAKGHYHGRTHEAFILDAGSIRQTVRWLKFDEVAKTPEQYRAKVERDLGLLREQVRETPDDPRWHYYLADTHAGLGQVDEALASFALCWRLDGWDEESAWAAYRIAEIESGRQQYVEATMWCTKGMQRHPGMAELPWLAGWCCYQSGRYQHAVWWEEMAFGLNKIGAERQRIGFRYPPALSEGPHDVMRHAYRALGDHDGEMVAEERFQRYLATRQQQEKIAAPSREG